MSLTMVFFPAAGCRPSEPGRVWEVPVHGWVYRPTEFSRLRRAGQAVAERVFSRKLRRVAGAKDFFEMRVGAFLSDNERGVRATVRIGETEYFVGKSSGSGHFKGIVRVSAEDALRAMDGDWLRFSCEAFRVHGRVMMLRHGKNGGVSVVSDLDDTIKVTCVNQKREMLRNTFARQFTDVPGMAEVFATWAGRCGTGGAAFHYVSASPWHLYPFLEKFLNGCGFPEGSWHLRDFRLVGRELAGTLRSSRRVKAGHIQKLMECYSDRQFVFVGDSGESDAQMYAAFARKYPQRVKAIFIRNVSGNASGKWAGIFAGLSDRIWHVFEKAEEIRGFRINE